MPNEPTIIPMSISTFYTGSSQKENPDEAFLLYSKGFENGPPINRDGMGEPWMEDRYKPEVKITHPIEQRRGTWLIDANEAKKIEEDLIRNDTSIDQKAQKELLKELDDTPNYFDEFKRYYPGYEIVGMQGCGNLTMNEWFVGYLSSAFTSNKEKFLYILNERLPERTYSCLVKWRDKSPHYTIEDLRFDVYVQRVRMAKNDSDITKDIEFAVFGQKLVEDGELVDFGEIARQFADIRHLYKLPNINPRFDFDSEKVRQSKRPRMLFQQPRNHDVWFGERQMTREEYLDLLMHALTEPVLLDTYFDGMGALWDLIRATFALAGYREVSAKIEPRARGEWRKYSDRWVQIYLQRNVYAYTMLGLNDQGNVIASAAGGLAGRIGQTIEAMAQNMISARSQHVLLIDEGNDVFQWINGDYTVKPQRGRIRALWIFARKKVQKKTSVKKRTSS